MALPDGLHLDNWPRRRRVINGALVFVAFALTWIIYHASEALNGQIALALIAAGTTLIMGYVFGAILDDRNKRDAGEQVGRKE